MSKKPRPSTRDLDVRTGRLPVPKGPIVAQVAELVCRPHPRRRAQPKLLSKPVAVHVLAREYQRTQATSTGIMSTVKACASLRMTRAECLSVLCGVDICSTDGRIYGSTSKSKTMQDILDHELRRYQWEGE